jgi:hypothetical protein
MKAPLISKLSCGRLRLLLLAGLLLNDGCSGRANDETALFQRVEGGDLPRSGLTYGGALLDLNGDGRQDLLLSRHGDQPAAYLNGGGLRFVSLTDPAALPRDLQDQHGLAACDFDGDGDDDVYLTLGAEHGTELSFNQLWIQVTPGSFSKVSSDNLLLADPVGRGRGALWADFDGDLRPELLLISYQSPARLLSWSGRAWRDATSWLPVPPAIPLWAPGWPPPSPAERARSMWIHAALVTDFDRDGHPDLLVLGRPGWSGLWRNTGRGPLQDYTCIWGLHPALWSHLPGHAAAGDVDGDGDPDLVLCYRPDRNARPQRGPVEIWRNELLPTGRVFVPAAAPLGQLGREVPEAGLLEDFDNDGHLDLYVVQNLEDGSGPANRLYLGAGDGSFREQPLFWEQNVPPGVAESALAADPDRDGDLDLLAGSGGGTDPQKGGGVVLYENCTRLRGVTLEMVSIDGPPHGLGAHLELTVNGRRQVREITSVASPFCASVPRAHFGVGDWTGPLELLIHWPSGREQQVTLPEAGAAYRVEEGNSTVTRLPCEVPEALRS